MIILFSNVFRAAHICVFVFVKKGGSWEQVRAGQTNMCLYLYFYFYLYLLKMEIEEQARLGQSWSDPPGICGLGHFLALECSITWILTSGETMQELILRKVLVNLIVYFCGCKKSIISKLHQMGNIINFLGRDYYQCLSCWGL